MKKIMKKIWDSDWTWIALFMLTMFAGVFCNALLHS